jgi:hypothetical protein
LKLKKLVCLLLVSAFAFAGCHSQDGSVAADGAGVTPQSLPAGDGTATLSWEAPTTTTTGASLTNLAGYRIYYGISEDDLSQTIQLAGVGLQTYVIDNLGQGTWYFAIRAVTSAGVESSLSNIVSKTIS